MSYEESFNTVLLQEAKRYNDLLKIVQSTLQDLLKALKGLIVISEQLEMIATSLFNNKIPVNWQSKSYPSLKSLGKNIPITSLSICNTIFISVSKSVSNKQTDIICCYFDVKNLL